MKRFLCLMATASVVVSLFSQTRDEARLKYNNPGLEVDLAVGLWGMPVPVDYDGDGLTDLLISCPSTPYKGVWYFRNIGDRKHPFFDKAVKLSDISYNDVMPSWYNGKLHVIRKGTEYTDFATDLFGSPRKIKVEETDGLKMVKERSNMWSYVDYDNDGDADIIAGIGEWGQYGWDNAYDAEGNWKNGPLHGYVFYFENVDGKYVNRGKIMAAGCPVDTYGAPVPNMYDFDGDGDLDLICGEFVDKLTWYENIGTREKPVFAEGRILKNDSGAIKFYLEMIQPVACDFDGDGDIDILVGDEDGRIAYLENTGTVKDRMPVFESPVYLRQKADCVKCGALSTPYSVDWDGDGLDDIVSGNSAGNICFIRNLGGGANPVWDAPVLLRTDGRPIRIMAGINGSIQGPAEEKWGYTVLSVADWDGDGRKDILVNSIFGEVIWFKNTGDPLNLEGPYKVKVAWKGAVPKPTWNWWNPGATDLVTQWRTTPIAVDWNRDGLTDLISLDHEGYLCFFERFRKENEYWLKPGRRIFIGEDISVYRKKNDPVVAQPGSLRLNDEAAGQSGRRKICFADWNNDGQPDLMVNSLNVAFLENTGRSGDTLYLRNRGDISTLRLAGHTTSPTPVDWDKDGIYDMLVGAEDGFFYLIKNNTETHK